MNKRTNARAFLTVATALTLAVASSSAEDIDVYVSAAAEASAPNVLMVIDNTSNWSANNNKWSKNTVMNKCGSDETCKKYVEQVFGNDSDLAQGQVEAAALKLVLDELICGPDALGLKVRLGFMFLNEEGNVDGGTAYISGYIRHRVTLVDSTQCTKIGSDLTAIRSNINNPTFKGPSSASYGLALFEAYKYFGAWTNQAGARTGTAGTPTGPSAFGPQRNSRPTDREDALAFTDASKSTYKSPITETCSKNYIIFVGNTWPNREPTYSGSQGSTPPSETYLKTVEGITPQIYPVPLRANDVSDIRFGDEWTRFLWETDVSPIPGVQNIRTYTINVFNQQPDAKQGRLLRSMARANDEVGKEFGYFEVDGNLKKLIDSFRDLLTQVAAENSVFASASLPVSANAQGLYLNQVFIGMFRPDANGHQRWNGNLKQFQFKEIPQVTPDGKTVYDLTLVDALGSPALDETTTGFLRQCARSFWSTDSGDYWKFVTGAESSLCTPAVTSVWSDLPDGPIVERGGAAQRLRAAGHASRTLRTCNSGCASATVPFDTTNVSPSVLSTNLVRWVRGENWDSFGDGYLTDQGVAYNVTYPNLPINPTTRPTIHGGVIHSRPLVVNYGTTTDDVVVFYGADDGVLRAVDGNTTGTTAGRELWGFIAPEHYSKFERLRSNSPKISYPGFPYIPTPRPKDYFFDGSIGGYQERTSTSNKVWLYATMRRGGRMVYAFDASARPSSSANPTLLWRFGCPSDTDAGCAAGVAGETVIGQTWSTPQPIRVRLGAGVVPLVAFGAGYDTCEDLQFTNDACGTTSKGRGIFVLDAKEGAAQNYRHFLPATGQSSGRFVSDVTALDINLDGYIDVLYAADTRGNLWRINTSNPADGYKGYEKVGDWPPMVLVASVSDWTGGSPLTDRRKFLYGVSAVSLANGQVIVQLGTGDREQPLANSQAAQVLNRFYGIRDNVTKTTQETITVVTHSGTGLAGLKDVTGVTSVAPEETTGYGGWYFNLVTTSPPYEQVVTTPLTIGGVTYFSTYQAKGEAADGVCYNLGTARAYRVDFQTGTKLPDAPLATEFLRGGFPPSPVAGIALVDGKKVPFIIGGPGGSQIGVDKPKLNTKKRRTPVYRYQRIDG